jgi:hypothetical protein
MATEPRTTHTTQHENEQHSPQAQQAQQVRQNPAKPQEPGTGKVSDKSAAELKANMVKQAQERMKGRPTPTQEELDKIALGEHPDLSDDGSGPDPTSEPAKGSAPYRTRDMAAR